MQEGKSNGIDLFYDSCEPDGQPTIPDIQGLMVTFRGKSASRTIINGKLSAKTILNFQATPTRQGSITIPEFRVATSEGEMTVPSVRFEVIEATVGNTGAKPDEVFLSVLQTRDTSIWQGEVFEIEYIAGAKQDYQLADLSIPEWEPKKIVTEGLVDEQVSNVNVQGSTYLVKLYKAKAMAPSSGAIEIEGTRQNATVVVGRRRDFMFQEPVYDSFAIEADPLTVDIKPLPENAPSSFKGAVGDFSLVSNVVPQEVQVGEPVTWTLELSGKGNWPAGIGVPARSVSSRFKAIQPEIKNEFPENSLFDGTQTEDIVLIPTEAGSFEFGPLSYTYFDTEAETYKTIEIPPTTVTVTPPTNDGATPTTDGSSGPTGTQGLAQSSDGDFDFSPSGENAGTKPPTMLKDPLKTRTELANPLAKIDTWQPTAIALAFPLAFWLVLALRQSLATDESKSRRQVLSKLKRLTRNQPPIDAKQLFETHKSWRDAAARYFGLEGEPSPQEIAAEAKKLRGDDFAKDWTEAWQLSDKTLFSSQEVDQSAWLEAAKRACDACPGYAYSPSKLFRYKAWVPALAVINCLSFAVQDSQAQSPDGEGPFANYESGDFKNAFTSWKEAVAKEPLVFENRYNAGIAAAQLGDWGAAWAYWTSAFCLDPSNESVVWNLKIAHQNTTAFDPTLNALLEGDGEYALIRLQSPAAWQSTFDTLIIAMGILLVCCVLALYLKPVRKFSAPVFLVALCCGLGAYFSVWAHSKYQNLGNPETLLVTADSNLMSVPTDLQTEQLSTTVGVGSTAKLEKTFLGWAKVSLVNGESGWLRRDNLLPLYGSEL